MRTQVKPGTIHCQRCLSANSLEEEFCGRCGTRLMLVVETSAARYDEEAAVGDYEEHLLERVSSLENHLTRFAEKLERALDLLARHARTSYIDHALLDTLLDVLDATGVADRRRVERAWRERFEREAKEAARDDRRSEVRSKIRAAFSGGARETFTKLLDEGFDLIGRGKDAQGLRALERAAALSTDNAPLNAFLGEHFFRLRKMALARDYLSRALAAGPDDRRVCLLLGLVCGDEGEAARAKGLLSKAVSGGRQSFAAHYALGRLHAAEADWGAALAEFKLALAARKCPEVHYVLAVVNYQLGRYRMSRKHLLSALKMDEDYGEVHYLLGHVHLRLGERALAAEEFQAAGSGGRGGDERGPVKRGVSDVGGVRVEEMPLPAFFRRQARGRKRLLTGGDDRLAAALREDALGDSI